MVSIWLIFTSQTHSLIRLPSQLLVVKIVKKPHILAGLPPATACSLSTSSLGLTGAARDDLSITFWQLLSAGSITWDHRGEVHQYSLLQFANSIRISASCTMTFSTIFVTSFLQHKSSLQFNFASLNFDLYLYL